MSISCEFGKTTKTSVVGLSTNLSLKIGPLCKRPDSSVVFVSLSASALINFRAGILIKI